MGIFYLFLSFILIFLVFKYGIKAAVEVSFFFQNRKNSPEDEELTESVILPPQFLPFPEATNSATLKVAGFSLPNQIVYIYLNGLEVKTLETDSEGKFESTISLALGINKIYGVAENPSGKRSDKSKEWEVFFNDSPPFIDILEPQNNSVIRRNQNPVTIKGKTDKTSKVFINDQRVIVDEEGNFNYQVLLQKGENKFIIKCIDPASNENQVELVLSYLP